MLWTIDPSSATPIRDQIATCIGRGVRSGELAVGATLPPAAELAQALSVDRNTVLAAYRQLRERGILEFRRGRGVRVAYAAPPEPSVVDAATHLLDVARRHGVGRDEVLELIREMT